MHVYMHMAAHVLLTVCSHLAPKTLCLLHAWASYSGKFCQQSFICYRITGNKNIGYLANSCFGSKLFKYAVALETMYPSIITHIMTCYTSILRYTSIVMIEAKKTHQISSSQCESLALISVLYSVKILTVCCGSSINA